MNTTKRNGTIDIILMMFLFIVSISIHYYYVTYLIQDISDKMQLFSMASVGPENVLGYLPHGAAYLYTLVLNCLLYVVGNKILVPVILQIVMKMLSFLLLFFALRMTAGRIGAFVTTTILLFLPMNYELLNQITPVVMSVLFICIQYVLFALLLKGIKNQLFTNYGWGILFVLYGIVCSITIYADIIGIFFFVISLIGFAIYPSHGDRKGLQNKVFQIFCTFLGTILGFIGLCCLVRFSFGIPFVASFLQYLHEYVQKIALIDYFYFFLVVASIFFGLILQSICNRFLPSHDANEIEAEIEAEMEIESAIVFEEDVIKQLQPLKAQPLNNPLPVPKRHERKEMNYALNPNEGFMEFDITHTKENDDFDID